MTLNLTAEKTRETLLAFLVKSYAAHTVGFEMMAKLLAVDSDEEAKIITEYNKRLDKKTDELFNSLIERVYNVDLDEILGQ